MTKNAATGVVRCLDLFCGAGGSSIGARLAGALVVGAVDCWQTAADAHSLNFPGATVLPKKLEDVDLRDLAAKIGDVDLILASPECTNHSPAKGKERRSEKSRAKAFEVIRFAKHFKPRWVVVENVVQMKNWKRFDEWHKALKALGYKTTMCTLSSHDYGVPQSRRRLFILADRKRSPSEPKRHRGPKPTARSVLTTRPPRGDLWVFSELFTKKRASPTKKRARKAISEVGKNTAFLLVYYGSDGAGGWQPLDKPLRTITTIDRFALVLPTRQGHVMRMLQPPELAGAMGFPKDYAWPKITRREKIKLIGNAVCPPVMKAIVEALTAPGRDAELPPAVHQLQELQVAER